MSDRPKEVPDALLMQQFLDTQNKELTVRLAEIQANEKQIEQTSSWRS
jgi:hypothetical protein